MLRISNSIFGLAAALLVLLFARELSAQSSVQQHYKIKKTSVVALDKAPAVFAPKLQHLEAPLPDGPSYRSFLMRQKIKSRALFPPKQHSKKLQQSQEAPQALVEQSFRMERKFPNGTLVPIVGGIPNDNTLAVSDSGILLAGINSLLFGWDLKADTAIFSSYVRSLALLASGGVNDDFYDPKVIYDPVRNRFIAVFLKNFDPANSGILVAFSTTDNPRDAWNVYTLPGNPLNNNRWTDFPAIAITENSLLITANLIIPNVSWQEGFDGSVIWQMNLNDGFGGSDQVDTKLFTDIRFGTRFIRNLHPVQGARGYADERVLLSNRNFDIQNDTVFVLRILALSDSTDSLDIRAIRTSLPYGVPPNGRQTDTDPNDPTGGLQTNDARVLGAVLYDNRIQYVANSVQPETGLSCIYHGFVEEVDGNTTIRGRYISDPMLDFGYPNIALMGNEDCDAEALIGFNYTAPDSFPGVACVYFSNDSLYSPLQIIKTGENYINRLPDENERWGDYFGLQRWYSRPGRAVLSGYYGLSTRNNATWFATLASPDSSRLGLQLLQGSGGGNCGVVLTATASGGTPPYRYFWNGAEGSATFESACSGDTLVLELRDNRSCSRSETVVVQAAASAGIVFPNPTFDRFAVRFNLKSESTVAAELFDLSGRKVAQIIEKSGKKGLNELSFSLEPLADGIYVLRISTGGKLLEEHRVLKQTQQ